MLSNGYFDIKRDIEAINAGGFFFCQGCLVGRPPDDMSSDPRYCESCYEFLLKEAELLPTTKRPKWIPKKGDKEQYHIPQHGDVIMSTLECKIFEVDTIHPSVGKVTHEKRGPKHKALPIELIMRFADEGMGSKAITTRIKVETGIKVSYKTIQRIVGGQRVLVL